MRHPGGAPVNEKLLASYRSWISASSKHMRPTAAAAVVCLCFAAHPSSADWPPGGLALYPPAHAEAPHVCTDGAGGAFVFWIDNRNEATTGDARDLFLQHVTGSGEIAAGWPDGGLPICIAREQQYVEGIIPDGLGGAIMVWDDDRTAFTDSVTAPDIYAQRVTGSGQIAPGWQPNGTPVCTALSAQTTPELVSDGAGGALFLWTDQRAGDYAAYGQHLLADGTIAPGWVANGNQLAAPASFSGGMLSDGAGGAFVGIGYYALHIDGSGHTASGWPPGGVLVPGGRGGGLVAPDGAGGMYFVSGEQVGPLYGQIYTYAVRLLGNGTLASGWPADEVPLCTVPYDFVLITLGTSDGQGGVYFAWEDTRNSGSTDIYAQRLMPDGSLAPGWPVNGLRVTAFGYQYPWGIVGDGFGGLYLTWYVSYSVTEQVMVQHLGGDAMPAPGWPVGGAVANPYAQTNSYSLQPSIASDGEHGAYVAWAQELDGVHVQRFAFGGGPVAVAVALVRAAAQPDRVDLEWQASRDLGADARVERRTGATVWESLGPPVSTGPQQLTYEDLAILPGAHYGYRLSYDQGGQRVHNAETWVEVPRGPQLALEGLRPNPSAGDLNALFSLPDNTPATIELLDICGRRMFSQEVGWLGAGQHLLRLGDRGSMTAGLYWLRLRQGGRVLTARAIVVR